MGWTTRIGQPKVHDEFGTNYVVLTIGGVKLEGDLACSYVPADFVPQAGVMFLDELETWLRDRKYIIWRVSPRVEFNPDTNMYKFYCRLSAYFDEIVFKKDVAYASNEEWQTGLLLRQGVSEESGAGEEPGGAQCREEDN